ncbi:MAG: TlpA family protein disulfide reductase [Crocinitomicaceae bacterium]|nr:TlpA family protein disulfide reductase [Crocinitomicaceae bacterium]
MQKLLLISLVFFGSIGALAQQNNSQTFPQPSVGSAFISGQIVGAPNQLLAFGNQNKGGVRTPLMTTKTDSTGKFSFTYTLPFKDYYYLKFQNGQILNMILHGGDSIKIYTDIRNPMELSNFVGSEESKVMNQFLVSFMAFKKVEDSLKAVVGRDPSKQNEVNTYFNPIAQDFYTSRNTFINKYAGSPAIVVTLNAINQDLEWDLYQSVVGLLQKSFNESPTIQNIVMYVDNTNKEKEAKKFLEPGNEAKEIAMANPEGDTLRLSSLRGNVVLIDFWASWCSPCRRENPNVVKLYNHYKDEGFTVFSVSLDSDMNRWKAAIEQDGLIWPNHVSDLQKWSNAAARDYLVKSIPFTVLIDKEGKVIGTNLRGVDLENQLKVIFGH